VLVAGARLWENAAALARRALSDDLTCRVYAEDGTTVNHEARIVFGPFHRRLAPAVQDAETVVRQILNGEIWGRPASWGGSPAVKAFSGALAPAASGIEFWSFQAPDTPAGPRVYWRTDGPFVRIDAENELARLKIAFVRITQDLHDLAQ
jgi:hypothetical protein